MSGHVPQDPIPPVPEVRNEEPDKIPGYHHTSVRRRRKKTSTRRRSRISFVVVETITTRRREGVGVVVEKDEKVDKLLTIILAIYLQQ